MASKILIVDDNSDNAETLVWAMKALGHDARMAVDGVSALDAIQYYTPDVVLCDLNMPYMNGYEVCDVMQQSITLKNTTFIAQTGWDDAMHRQASKAHGFHHHLVKPIDLDKLHLIMSAPRAGT
jgi:CheY-like chemotaxis protein